MDFSSKPIISSNAPRAIGPYSQAIQIGQFIFVSGQLGIESENGQLKIGVEDQAIQAFKNLEFILQKAGAKLENVVKTTVFLKDMRDFAKVNEIYSYFMKEPYPARSAIQIAELPMQGLVEVEAIAYRPEC